MEHILNPIDNCIDYVYTTIIEGDRMEAKIQKWGNSAGIRIPSSLLKSLDLKANDKVELEQKGNKIVISKLGKKHLTLEERIANYKGENIIEDYDWGEPRGKEIW